MLFGLPGAVDDLARDGLREQFETTLFSIYELTNLTMGLDMRAGVMGVLATNSSVLGFIAMTYRGGS